MSIDTPEKVVAFKKFRTQYLKRHRGVPDGRNFRFWKHDGKIGYDEQKQLDRQYVQNFERIFPNGVGSDSWFDKKFGSNADKGHTYGNFKETPLC